MQGYGVFSGCSTLSSRPLPNFSRDKKKSYGLAHCDRGSIRPSCDLEAQHGSAELPLTSPTHTTATLDLVRRRSLACWTSPGRRLLVQRGFMTMASTSPIDAQPEVAAPARNDATTTTASNKPKLHGRAFYESIGSPKFVVAPMVDQSEFVCYCPPCV